MCARLSHPKTLHAIAPYVNNNIEIGTVISSGGFFWMARHELGKEHRLFGFQRVPYISRVKEYGKSAELKDINQTQDRRQQR